MPGKEPTSSAHKVPVDRAGRPVSNPGNQRQRHRVRDVRADDARHRQLRVEQQKHGDADRAGPDRRNRDQHAKRDAHQHGRAGSGADVELLQRQRKRSMMALRNNSDVAVSKSAKQSTRLTRLRDDSPLRSSCHRTKSVRMLAGILPLASRITAGQWMLALANPGGFSLPASGPIMSDDHQVPRADLASVRAAAEVPRRPTRKPTGSPVKHGSNACSAPGTSAAIAYTG